VTKPTLPNLILPNNLNRRRSNLVPLVPTTFERMSRHPSRDVLQDKSIHVFNHSAATSGDLSLAGKADRPPIQKPAILSSLIYDAPFIGALLLPAGSDAVKRMGSVSLNVFSGQLCLVILLCITFSVVSVRGIDNSRVVGIFSSGNVKVAEFIF